MSYKLSWRDLPDVPRHCPMCDGKRVDAEAVKVHNLRCALMGEREYLLTRK